MLSVYLCLGPLRKDNYVVSGPDTPADPNTNWILGQSKQKTEIREDLGGLHLKAQVGDGTIRLEIRMEPLL